MSDEEDTREMIPDAFVKGRWWQFNEETQCWDWYQELEPKPVVTYGGSVRDTDAPIKHGLTVVKGGKP
jgi:hypothetical protein